MYFIQHISYHHDVNNSENWCSKLVHFEAEFIGIFPVRNQVFNSERMNAVQAVILFFFKLFPLGVDTADHP